MEKKTACTDLPLSSSKTIDDYHQSQDKQLFIAQVLRDQEVLRRELRDILTDIDRYKKRTNQLIDGLITDNVKLRQQLAKQTEKRPYNE